MSWIDFSDAQGRNWQVNQDSLYLMARASIRADLANRYTREVRTGEGWFDGPVMVEIVTDWGKVNRETDQASNALYNTLAREVIAQPENSARNFAHIISDTRLKQNELRSKQQRGMQSNMEAVTRHVTNWEHGLAATRFVRDTSWTVLILLSAVPTGGASTAAGGTALVGTAGTQAFGLTVGSIGRGQATYQDTGNVGAAVVNGAGSFVTGAIGLPPGGGTVISSGQQAVLLGVQSVSAGGFAGLQSHVEGHSAETAAWNAISAAGFNFAGGRMSGSNTFTNMTLPAQITVQLGAENLGTVTSNAIQDADSSTSSRPPPAPLARGRLTHSGVPANTSGDTDHIRANILRQRP